MAATRRPGCGAALVLLAAAALAHGAAAGNYVPPAPRRRSRGAAGAPRNVGAAGPVSTPSSMWPLPQSVTPATANVTCSGITPLLTIDVAGHVDDVLVDGARRYGQIFFAYGPAAPPPTPASSTIDVVTVTVTTADDKLRFGINESYVLKVTANSASIVAPTSFGALWGLEALSQLIQRTYTVNAAGAVNGSYYSVCPVVVSDAPRFPFRGLLVDTARHFISVPALMQVIDLMSYLRMNAMHLHLTDEVWPVYIPALPLITNVSAFSPMHVYSPADLAAVVEYGRLRGVIVFPEIDTPQHSTALLAAYPDLGCFVATPAPGYRCLFDPLNPSLWPTLEAIWGAMHAIFPLEYPFHIGGDEVDLSCWTSCANATAWAKKAGVDADGGYALYAAYEHQLYEYVAGKLGRTVIAWEDLTGLVTNYNLTWPNVANRLVLEQWDGSPGTWNWDTCDQLATNASVIVSGPFTILQSPQYNYVDIGNVTCASTPRMANGMWGPEIMLWDDAQDTSGSDILVSAMQSLMAVAESGWSAQAVVVNPDGIDAARYADHRCRLAVRGVTSHPGPYAPVNTFCTPEYTGTPAPWNADGVAAALAAAGSA